MKLSRRPRRLRDLKTAKSMVRECELKKEDLILPVFVSDHCKSKEKIESMPEVYRWSIDELLRQIESWHKIGINAFAFFLVENQKKCPLGKEALNLDSVCYRAAKKIKENFPDILLIADLALDPFTDHGHDGILDAHGKVDNDLTVDVLCKSSVIAAESGFDIVAPSDMMDGRVGQIRNSLDNACFEKVAILAYSAKFCSSYYGPFRDAISSAQKIPLINRGINLTRPIFVKLC